MLEVIVQDLASNYLQYAKREKYGASTSKCKGKWVKVTNNLIGQGWDHRSIAEQRDTLYVYV